MDIARRLVMERGYGSNTQPSWVKNSIDIYPYVNASDAGKSIPGGNLVATITYSDDQTEVLVFKINTLSMPEASLDQQGSVVICKDKGATITALVPPAANYTYAWGGAATGSLNVIGSTSSKSIQLSSQQWSQNTQWLTLTVTNPATLCRNTLGIDIYPSPRWISTSPGGNGASGYEILPEANIVADKKGNIYYVGKTYSGNQWINRIFTYQWVDETKTWYNFAYLFPQDPSPGIQVSSFSLAVTTDGLGKRKLYYINVLGQLVYVEGNSLNEYKNPSEYSPVVVKNNVKEVLYAVYNSTTGSDDVLYISNNQLWLYRNSNHYAISPISQTIGESSVIAGTKIVFTMDARLYVCDISSPANLNNPAVQPVSYLSDASPALVMGGAVGGASMAAYNNIIYFTDQKTGYIAQADLATLKAAILRSDTPALGNGSISVNTATGVIYYLNYEKGISQLYKGGSISGCEAPAWSASQVYQSTNPATLVQHNGVLYRANYWSQGKSPANWAGGAGSGQPWTSLGACNPSGNNADTWQVAQISNPIWAYGNVTFSYPNVFYTKGTGLNGGLNIGMTYFFTGNCEPGIQRLSDEKQLQEEIREESNFKIWPNPVQSAYHVEIELVNDAHVFTEVTSLLGQTVAATGHGKMQAGKHTLVLDSNSLTNGTYILKIYTDGNDNWKEKIVVVH